MNNYKQLQLKERHLIDYLLNQENKSISQIAKTLKRNKSTISREIKRNKLQSNYQTNDAIFHSKIINLAKHSFSINKYQAFLSYFYQNFDAKYFGVEVCISMAKKEGILVPSIKTVYNWINYNVIKINAKSLLRPWKKSYFKKKYSSYLGKLSKYIIPITYRPKCINKRQRYGDYEIDLINSKQGIKSSLLTLVDRKTRYGHVIKVASKHMNHINEKLLELINKNHIKIKTITKDNGAEFNALTKITKNLNIKVYTCNPYASCERGTNENFNGLIRRIFPKGTNFDNIKETEIQNVINKINKMPRKIFEYLSSKNLYEAFKISYFNFYEIFQSYRCFAVI